MLWESIKTIIQTGHDNIIKGQFLVTTFFAMLIVLCFTMSSGEFSIIYSEERACFNCVTKIVMFILRTTKMMILLFALF
jgi:hypothetical protein